MTLRTALASLLLATSPIAAFAAPPAAPSRHLEGKDLFNLEVATDPQIRPDGGAVAYVRRSNDIMTDKTRPTIWLVDTRTGAQTPLAAGPGAHSLPRWSPDGTGYAARRNGMSHVQ